ncbi:hypothetical protein CMEL01_03054 [Colletotrichum melonis]|uniref:Uncharacterized protein n=1 Tax=Colletotrichum melonis TaxID=1209925 RepID=A0AAI9UKA8_9PEZI|nr:hypothetical protein CMEL01_03054 [Colletotrichum melonis]
MRLSAIFLVAAQAATIVAQASCFCECNRTPDASGCAALPRPASGNCAELYLTCDSIVRLPRILI